jgi:hypothetical protein
MKHFQALREVVWPILAQARTTSAKTEPAIYLALHVRRSLDRVRLSQRGLMEGDRLAHQTSNDLHSDKQRLSYLSVAALLYVNSNAY